MYKKVLALITVLLLAVAVFAGCGGGADKASSGQQGEDKATEAEKTKVAFIYVGPAGDAGWSYAHDLGRKYLEENVSGIEVTPPLESVPEGADAEQVIENLVQKGNKIIFATSFGYMDAMEKVAKRHPDVYFLHCSGNKTLDNMGTYFGRIYQPRYLSGIVAGKTTKSNTIGYVAAFPIPEVVRGINAFTLGVRSVNPDAKVKVVWTNTWYDPAKEKDAAKSLLEQGADVVAQHQDTPGPMQAAEEAGKFGVSYNSDMRQFAPKAVLTGPVWNWGPYYAETVQAILDGTWKSEQYWGPIGDDIVDLAPYGDMVTDDVKALVDAKKKEIVDGTWDVFTGPIKDNTGKERVAAGAKLTDQEMLSLDWFVEGVDGTVTKQ
ncbi:BMP family ABC transporter substrate-binding protein [Phosphitispora fastidiosa]|uniref:BMP family ABC transporter substrate-binding protein n=1 Tax=Phosphitispora fastidiosa TaxID=2837202 RepID=UPI001E54A31B|nr:BMP family ABC transporter substrate-binding protein [Phosphitispora fastidiosa]MBU7006215.1 basic membrane protein A [Phosphitispora fastidiosa]